MPMPINSLEEYQKVLNVSWFSQDQPAEELTCDFALVLVFAFN